MAGQLQSLILRDAFAGRATFWVGIVAPELLERLAFWADVLVVLGIPFEVSAGPCAILTSSLIEHWDVGFDVALH